MEKGNGKEFLLKTEQWVNSSLKKVLSITYYAGNISTNGNEVWSIPKIVEVINIVRELVKLEFSFSVYSFTGAITNAAVVNFVNFHYKKSSFSESSVLNLSLTLQTFFKVSVLLIVQVNESPQINSVFLTYNIVFNKCGT